MRRDRPAVAAALLLLAVLAAVGFASVRLTGGRFVYPLDDTYIHMAMARTLAGSGTWGFAPESFASASSSPLWTSLLALAYAILGPGEIAPLVLNAVLAVVLVFVVSSLFRRFGVTPRERFLSLLAIILFAPLAPLVFCGIEHVLHALLAVLFVEAAAAALRPPPSSSPARLLVLAPLLAMARFESLFLLVFAALLLAARKRFGAAGGVLALGFAPVAALGLISTANGWFFLPNSVLLKGRLPDALSLAAAGELLGNAAAEVWRNPHVLVLSAAAAAVLALRLRRKRPLFEPAGVFAVLFLLGMAAQVVFAHLGWFYRYEAYLMVLGTVALVFGTRGLTAASPRPAPSPLRLFSLLALALLLAAVPGWRGIRATAEVPRASRNIYEQQIQVAAFIRAHYSGAAVALNDIGAAQWYARFRCLDLWGLADIDVARARLAKTYRPETMAAFAARAGVRIAVVYEEWFDRFGGLPAGWVKVGRWTIEDNIVCGGPTVAFFAVRPEEAGPLAEALSDFQAELPPRVLSRISWKGGR